MKLFQNLRSKRMFYRILFLLLSMVCVMFLISFLFIGSYISRSYERQAQESARQLLGTASEYVDLAVLDLSLIHIFPFFPHGVPARRSQHGPHTPRQRPNGWICA